MKLKLGSTSLNILLVFLNLLIFASWDLPCSAYEILDLEPNYKLALIKSSIYSSSEFASLDATGKENLCILLNNLNPITLKQQSVSVIERSLIDSYTCYSRCIVAASSLLDRTQRKGGLLSFSDIHKSLLSSTKNSKNDGRIDRFESLDIDRKVCLDVLTYICSVRAVEKVTRRFGFSPAEVKLKKKLFMPPEGRKGVSSRYYKQPIERVDDINLIQNQIRRKHGDLYTK